MDTQKLSTHPPHILTLKGDLDDDAWNRLLPLIQQILQQDIQEFQVDLKNVQYTTSAGLALLELLQSIMTARKGTLTLLNPQPYLREYLIHQNFTILDTL